MAIISIKGMEFYAYHGCFKEEQLIGTKFTVDLDIETDVRISSESDELSDTVDYQILYTIVKEQMMKPSKLLEHVCQRILDAIAAHFPVISNAKVSVSKMNPPLGGKLHSVSLTMEYHGK